MRTLNSGEFVRVYRNLHKKTYSIQKYIDGRWLVVKYSDSFFLGSATFKVREKGRQRVLQAKRKNVHAFIYGIYTEIIHWCLVNEKFKVQTIKYDPYQADYFFDIKTNEKIDKASIVKFSKDGVKAINVNKLQRLSK